MEWYWYRSSQRWNFIHGVICRFIILFEYDWKIDPVSDSMYRRFCGCESRCANYLNITKHNDNCNPYVSQLTISQLARKFCIIDLRTVMIRNRVKYENYMYIKADRRSASGDWRSPLLVSSAVNNHQGRPRHVKNPAVRFPRRGSVPRRAALVLQIYRLQIARLSIA